MYRALCNRDDATLAGLSDNLAVTAHLGIMQNASRERKHLLHNDIHYARHMTDAAERLRIARLRAGFTTAKEAAEAMGFPVSTYLAHENGSRGYPVGKAATYARKFKVPEVWLLYGTGPGPGTEAQGDETAEVVSIIQHLPPLRRAEALRILRVLAGGEA
jgi:transcriptional regulator with XRE-family HTH domain